jgi:hypothetical protein
MYVFAYPGATAKNICDQLLIEFLPPPSRIEIVILHVGTNNAATSRMHQPLAKALTDIQKCILILTDYYPNAVIYYRLKILFVTFFPALFINKVLHWL